MQKIGYVVDRWYKQLQLPTYNLLDTSVMFITTKAINIDIYYKIGFAIVTIIN